MNRRDFLFTIASILPASLAVRITSKTKQQSRALSEAELAEIFFRSENERIRNEFASAIRRMNEFTDVEGNPTSGRPSKINIRFAGEKEIWFDFSKGEAT